MGAAGRSYLPTRFVQVGHERTRDRIGYDLIAADATPPCSEPGRSPAVGSWSNAC